MPAGPSLTMSLCGQVLCDQGSKTLLPLSNRLVSECQTALQQHLSKVTSAQLRTESRENDEQDDSRRIFQGVERSSRPLIESSLPVVAPRGSRAKGGVLAALRGRQREAVRTVHAHSSDTKSRSVIE